MSYNERNRKVDPGGEFSHTYRDYIIRRRKFLDLIASRNFADSLDGTHYETYQVTIGPIRFVINMN